VFFLIHVFTYMDDLIGKGMGFWVLMEFFTYSFVTFIPVAMPLAVLLSSIMTFGSLAENYELAAMKASGLSLFKIIKPIFSFIILLAIITFAFNNFILPGIYLKSARLLWDIRQSKPSISIKEGIFYNQLNGYSIKIDKKSKDGQTLKKLSIYSHVDGLGNNIQLYADSGTMRTSGDTNYLQLKLMNGIRYQDVMQEESHKRTHPLMQLLFKEMIVNIDMSDFKMKHTKEDLFKGHHEMMNIWQINNELDTFRHDIQKKQGYLKKQYQNYFLSRTYHTASISNINNYQNLKSFYKSLDMVQFRNSVENAQNLVRNSSGFIDTINSEIDGKNIDITQYRMGWHKKISISFACIILFFVGASLGAIIRKGGMGLPVVVAVIFFLLYYIVTIVYQDLVIEGVYNVPFGAWFPLLLFLPIAIFLTYKAARDSALFDLTYYLDFFKKLFLRLKKTPPIESSSNMQ
jgi:lipopolysaccharide export system permease protein